MDPTATLELIRTELALHRMGSDEVDVDALVNAMDNLDTWMTRHGFLPQQWTPAANPDQSPPRVEVIHERDYDGFCDISIFVEGKAVSGYDEYSFDPGAGQVFRDYCETLSNVVANASPRLKGRLRESAYAAICDRYVDYGPDDDRVAHRYFDLWVLRHEREAAHGPSNATPPTSPTACEGVAL